MSSEVRTFDHLFAYYKSRIKTNNKYIINVSEGTRERVDKDTPEQKGLKATFERAEEAILSAANSPFAGVVIDNAQYILLGYSDAEFNQGSQVKSEVKEVESEDTKYETYMRGKAVEAVSTAIDFSFT
ncbi:hypothetical protein PMAYCL1PPCAC_00600, partial [Pristionchus mayeri]